MKMHNASGNKLAKPTCCNCESICDVAHMAIADNHSKPFHPGAVRVHYREKPIIATRPKRKAHLKFWRAWLHTQPREGSTFGRGLTEAINYMFQSQLVIGP